VAIYVDEAAGVETDRIVEGGRMIACGCGATATRFVDGVGWCCDVHFPDPSPADLLAEELRAAEAALTTAVGVFLDSPGSRYVAGLPPADRHYGPGNALADAYAAYLAAREKE